ncbi:LysR family transcriptional regulator, partial [gut metagenome]
MAAPHAMYIARGIADFLNRQRCTLDVRYLELSAQAALEALVRGEVQLAVVRYQSIYEEYYKSVFAQSGLAWRVLMQYKAVVLMAQNHPLASKEHLTPQQLADYPQLVEGDIQLPVDLCGKVLKEEQMPGNSRIYVQDRASQMILLKDLRGSYMWSQGLSPAELSHRHLVQRPCNGGNNKD